MQRNGANEARPTPPDAEVVSQVLAGHGDAYRILVRRYQDMLYRHALRMTGNGDAAADLVQTALVRAYQRLDRCRDPERFGAWLFRILSNACKDYLKNRRRRDVSLDGPIGPSAVAREDPERDLENAELRRSLRKALSKLPDGQREAFWLKHAEGLSYEQIAELLGGVSISALKMRVMRAREALKALLQEAN